MANRFKLLHSGMGVVSSSAQVDYTQLQNKPSSVASSSYADYAVTASYALNGGSGSGSLPTGSTKWGTVTTDKHQFTGSLSVTGSMSVMGGDVIVGGNVGIGTTAPSVKLEMASESEYPDVRVSGYSWVPAMSQQFARGTAASPTIVQNGDRLAGWFARAYRGDTFASDALLKVEVDGAPVANTYVPTRFVFETRNSTSRAERMRIDNAGNVGIGTNSPITKLDVAGGVHVGSGTENISNSSKGLSVQCDSGGAGAMAVGAATERSTGIIWYDGNPGSAVLYTFSNAAPITITGRDLHLASGDAERLTVANNGNVGIGTTAPSAKLEVNVNDGQSSTMTGLYVFDSANTGYFVADLRSNWTDNNGGDLLRVRNASGNAILVKNNRALQLAAYGAGTLITDSSGNVTATSDGRMKDVSGSFDRGLDAIINLSPKVYHWKEESGLNTEDVNVGLIAQEVLPYIPEAVACKDDRYTMSDRPIIAALINAVKELAQKNAALEAVVSKLADNNTSLEARLTALEG